MISRIGRKLRAKGALRLPGKWWTGDPLLVNHVNI